jgi:hypothetical protein
VSCEEINRKGGWKVNDVEDTFRRIREIRKRIDELVAKSGTGWRDPLEPEPLPESTLSLDEKKELQNIREELAGLEHQIDESP